MCRNCEGKGCWQCDPYVPASKPMDELAADICDEMIQNLRHNVGKAASKPDADEVLRDTKEALGNLIGTVIVHYPEWDANPLVSADVRSAVAALSRAAAYRKEKERG